MRTLALAFSGFALSFAACGSDGEPGGTGTGGVTGTGGRTGGAGGGTGGGTGGSGTGGGATGGAGGGTGGVTVDAGGDGSLDVAADGSADGPGTTDGPGGSDGSAGGMSFFVTSVGAGTGGNLAGLEGADKKCQDLATAVGAGGRTWKAYLSTSTVDARTRIGAGPWRNQKGVVIAETVAQLHEEGGAMNMIRTGNTVNAIDENGAAVANDVHDILTGSTAMGTKDAMGRHCTDWTSTMGMAANGHSNRMGGANNSWNAVHAVGCGAINGNQNRVAGTVSSGGGRGSIYCFASN